MPLSKAKRDAETLAMEHDQCTRRCAKCILPASFPHITFDDAGVCNYCHRWDRNWKDFDYAQAEAGLVQIFEAAKAKKRQYDCLVPFSGGRDSSYVLYLCKTKYKLTPLAVTFNNLFMSEYALRNITRSVEKLGVDHVFVTYRPELLKRLYGAMVRRGGEFCSICTAGINYVKITYQRLFRIPLVVGGAGSRVDEQSPFEVTCTHPLYIRRALSEEGFSREDVDALLIKRDYQLSALEKVKLKLRDDDCVQVRMPDYLPWKNSEIQDVLNRELGWETPDPEKDHIDCEFAPVKYYLKNRQIPHFIFKQEKFSQLIRDGQMTRAEAMESLNKLLESEDKEPAELEEFLRFLELEREEIENRERRSHLDYICKEDTRPKEDLLFRCLALPWRIYKRLLKPPGIVGPQQSMKEG